MNVGTGHCSVPSYCILACAPQAVADQTTKWNSRLLSSSTNIASFQNYLTTASLLSHQRSCFRAVRRLTLPVAGRLDSRCCFNFLENTGNQLWLNIVRTTASVSCSSLSMTPRRSGGYWALLVNSLWTLVNTRYTADDVLLHKLIRKQFALQPIHLAKFYGRSDPTPSGHIQSYDRVSALMEVGVVTLRFCLLS